MNYLSKPQDGQSCIPQPIYFQPTYHQQNYSGANIFNISVNILPRPAHYPQIDLPNINFSLPPKQLLNIGDAQVIAPDQIRASFRKLIGKSEKEVKFYLPLLNNYSFYPNLITAVLNRKKNFCLLSTFLIQVILDSNLRKTSDESDKNTIKDSLVIKIFNGTERVGQFEKNKIDLIFQDKFLIIKVDSHEFGKNFPVSKFLSPKNENIDGLKFLAITGKFIWDRKKYDFKNVVAVSTSGNLKLNANPWYIEFEKIKGLYDKLEDFKFSYECKDVVNKILNVELRNKRGHNLIETSKRPAKKIKSSPTVDLRLPSPPMPDITSKEKQGNVDSGNLFQGVIPISAIILD